MPRNLSTRESIDIETAGNAVALGLAGRPTVELVIRGDAAADYTIDVRDEGGTWLTGVGPDYTGAANYNDTLRTGAEEIRVRCTTGTATAGDSAEIYLSGSGA